MKKMTMTLSFVLVLTSLLVACLGAYLKYEVLMPAELFQEESIMEVPFLLLSDSGAQYTLEYLHKKSLEPEIPETEPPTEPTETPAAEATETPTEPPTEPPIVEVDESWFADVLFIGDSRTVGLRDYARIGEAQYFCAVGMKVFNIWEVWAMDETFPYTTLDKLLTERQYGKIYIGLGMNDVCYNAETFGSAYQELVGQIREYQPDAVIVLQSIMAVTEWKNEMYWYYTMENINGLNGAIAAIADGDRVRFIDVNTWITDEEGFLPMELSGDGVHLYYDGYNAWAQWILDTAGELRIP